MLTWVETFTALCLAGDFDAAEPLQSLIAPYHAIAHAPFCKACNASAISSVEPFLSQILLVTVGYYNNADQLERGKASYGVNIATVSVRIDTRVD